MAYKTPKVPEHNMSLTETNTKLTRAKEQSSKLHKSIENITRDLQELAVQKKECTDKIAAAKKNMDYYQNKHDNIEKTTVQYHNELQSAKHKFEQSNRDTAFWYDRFFKQKAQEETRGLYYITTKLVIRNFASFSQTVRIGGSGAEGAEPESRLRSQQHTYNYFLVHFLCECKDLYNLYFDFIAQGPPQPNIFVEEEGKIDANNTMDQPKSAVNDYVNRNESYHNYGSRYSLISPKGLWNLKSVIKNI